MTPVPSSELRLLPWTTETGKPCYLNGNANSGLALYADEMEEAHLTMGGDALKRAVQALEALAVEEEKEEAFHVLEAAAVALSNALRVADSRGARLPGHEGTEIMCGTVDDDQDDGDGPQLPAESFG
ncbi:hypothetical protein ACFYMO_12910 [Streptomyces sp. NPDC007025]